MISTESISKPISINYVLIIIYYDLFNIIHENIIDLSTRDKFEF